MFFPKRRLSFNGPYGVLSHLHKHRCENLKEHRWFVEVFLIVCVLETSNVVIVFPLRFGVTLVMSSHPMSTVHIGIA
jgi:hypothetical protein